MPGTILVSVLEFMDLPSSSPSSSISIKVSLGPRSAYQTWEKKDLSFPLATLRDKLIVLLHDSEGNEISETGIETRSIVEKGLWDDLFPLKGGGFLHMKFHFVLNEEERNRIRMMRESAVKKKHGEFYHSSPTTLQSIPSARNSFASLLSLDNVITDKNEDTSSAITVQQRLRLSPTELSPVPLPAKPSAKASHVDEPITLLSSSQPVVGTNNVPKLLEDKPHRHEETSSAITVQQRDNLSPTELNPVNLADTIDDQPLPAKLSSKASYVHEPATLLSGSQPVFGTINVPKFQEDKPHRNQETSPVIYVQQREVSPRKVVGKIDALPLPAKLPTVASSVNEPARSFQPAYGTTNRPKFQEDKPQKLEEQIPLEKAPRNVKNMISAFETGLSEDKKPKIKPATMKVLSNRGKIGDPPNQRLKEAKKLNTEISESILKEVAIPLASRKLQNELACCQSGEETTSLGDIDGTKTSDEIAMKSRFKPIHQEVDIKQDNLLKDLSTSSTSRTVEVSDRSLDEQEHIPVIDGRKSSDEIAIKSQFKPIHLEVDIKQDELLRHLSTTSTSETVEVPERLLEEQEHVPVIEEMHQPEISSTKLQKVDIQGVPDQVCTSKANYEDRHNPFESSGGWIFPDEAMRLCVTASGKKVMDLLGNCCVMKPDINQETKSFPPPENVQDQQENVDSGNTTQANNNEKNHRPKELHEAENSETETSGVAVGQAIKVAIMFGFGTLVLLTRQRKNR